MIETPFRTRIDLNDGWEFVLGRAHGEWLAGRGRDGEPVDLPHCWNRGDTFQRGRRSYSGYGAYRRQLDLPTAGGDGAWRLHSDGFYGIAEIWLDGRRLARVDAQYLGFDLELPLALEPGRHLLALRLDNRFHRDVLPGRRDPDFLLYGGLAGRVWLEWAPALRIEEETAHVVSTPGPEGAEILVLRCGIRGLQAPPSGLRLNWIVTDSDGSQVAAAGPVAVDGNTAVISTMVPRPRCWSPGTPHLYWAEGRLDSDDGPADAVRVRFGITRAEFRPGEGLFLDGHRVDLHGCNRHESIPGLGNALPEELHRADARLLRDYGCNFVRLSHYPQHPSFLDACDELGIMAHAEIATWKSVSSRPGWRRAARRQMRDLVLRDRHHPSVILWGMGNEARSRKAFLELREIARTLDPARRVIYAENHLYRARRENTVGIPDVWGVNYELEALEEAREACGLRVVIASECCNNPYSARGDDRAELTQVATLEHEWRLMAERPYLAGHAVWSFTDYATEYRKRYRRLTGLFDAWRKPKMAAELFRARYAKEPFVSTYVTATADDRRELHIFSNCDRVRIIVDDRPAVRLDGERHLVADLDGPYRVLKVEGTRSDVTVRDEVRTWGEPSKVGIAVPEYSQPGGVAAVDLSICDASGTLVRDWNGHVSLSIEGDARLYAYTDAGEVLMSRGEGRAYLELGRSGGEVLIRASADRLDPASLVITPTD